MRSHGRTHVWSIGNYSINGNFTAESAVPWTTNVMVRDYARAEIAKNKSPMQR
jgi:hypothetical protein